MGQVQLAKGDKVSPDELDGLIATTTSIPRPARGHNAMILYADINGVGQWSFKLQAGISKAGPFMDMYDNNGNLMGMDAVTADKAQLLVGIPEHFKIVATEDVNGATATVHYELLTV